MRETINGVAVEWLDPEGPELGQLQSALDLIGDGYGQGIELLAIPTHRLDPQFFRLASGLAGAFVEKLQQYGYRLAVVGDVEAFLTRSRPFRDFVSETNRRGQHFFVHDAAELRVRLK